MRDKFSAGSGKASESVPEGSVRMTDTEMAQKTPADVHGLGANQYYCSTNEFLKLDVAAEGVRDKE